jgi:hypothetical protein
MLDGSLKAVSGKAFRRVRFMLEHFEGMQRGLGDLEAECLSECWLALEQGADQTEIPKLVSNALRLKTRPARTALQRGRDSAPGGATYTPMGDFERQLDAETYLGVLQRSLKPEEYALLKAREILEVPFEELALRSLRANGVPATSAAQLRESARIRKQLHRLRKRCASVITAAYPQAAEDIGCWN